MTNPNPAPLGMLGNTFLAMFVLMTSSAVISAILLLACFARNLCKRRWPTPIIYEKKGDPGSVISMDYIENHPNVTAL
ncbi:Hypp231 [Branchiostoma lanceolatum]|nr:Hypp231 [Branchiostoma lanceolatum]